MAELSPNALRVLEARYLRRDASRRVVETPAELFRRVARAVAQAELPLGPAWQAEEWQGGFHSPIGRAACRGRGYMLGSGVEGCVLPI